MEGIFIGGSMIMDKICMNDFFRHDPIHSLPNRRVGRNGYILIEVLVAMTIFAISGGVLMHSLMSAFEATKTLRDMTKAIFLTQTMLHELELRYARRAEVQLGDFDGYYPYAGTAKFRWHSRIEYDKKKDAYVITVRTTWENATQSRRRRGRWQGEESGGITLKSMVLTARYNENLAYGFGTGGGGRPEVRKRGESGNQQGGRR